MVHRAITGVRILSSIRDDITPLINSAPNSSETGINQYCTPERERERERKRERERERERGRSIYTHIIQSMNDQ